MYVVVRDRADDPTFLEANPAGWFKGKDPSVTRERLQSDWTKTAGMVLEIQRHGDAVRARSRAALDEPGDLHDPAAVSSSYLICAAILQI